jgi:endonuclease/exonuclease/phosphatase family metal-dependent hydrolase
VRNIRIGAGRIAAGGIAAIAVLAIVTFVAPQSSGPLALAQIFVLHLVMAGIGVGCLLALVLRTPAVAIALTALLVVGAVRFGSELISLPSGGGPGERVTLVSWNLELGARAAGEIAGPLLDHHADLVSLQELTPDAAAAIDADPGVRTRYPFRLLRPDPGTFGVGLLSAFPIVASKAFDAPIGLLATLDLGQGRRLAVLDAHPLPGRIGSGFLGLPMTFDGRERDAAIERVREHIDELTDGGLPFVVAGDFNTAPTEPAYALLAHGLRDVHVEVGLGPGWTWRPSRLESLGTGFLRIDLVLAGGGVRPAAITVDCGHPGDHCIVDAGVVVP